MRSMWSFVSCCLFGLALAACGTARDEAQSGSTLCFGCHSETSVLGDKILWAQSGYDLSVHKNGQVERIYTQLNAAPPGGCAPFTGECFVAVGTEFAGSNAFYANSGGCQMCHTHEGFRKRVAGEYDPPDGSYSLKTSWDTRAQVGSPSTTPNTPLTADVIKFPSPVGCFTCHTPHGGGTPDNVTLPQTIPVGTQVTTQTGAVYGANKQKGHICAECHQIRLNNQPSTIASILGSVKGTSGKFNITAPYGTHHGPQTDMLLGKGGAEYAGTAEGGFAFAGAYNNSTHTVRPDADCVSCHMQSDFSDINVTGSFSVNAAVGGHSFTNKGFVHGQEKALVIGCGSVTSAGSCHTAPGVSGSSGSHIDPANVTTPSGYLQSGDAFFKKTLLGSPSVTQNYHLQVNELLSKLATPEADCAGLLDDAAVAAGGALAWDKMVDEVTTDPRCISSGSTTGVDKAANPADDNTNPSVRFVKALWNYKFIREDKSFGVHNTRYALELLYDSCADLASLTGKTCGSTAGRCTFCEGEFVTTRP